MESIHGRTANVYNLLKTYFFKAGEAAMSSVFMEGLKHHVYVHHKAAVCLLYSTQMFSVSASSMSSAPTPDAPSHHWAKRSYLPRMLAVV